MLITGWQALLCGGGAHVVRSCCAAGRAHCQPLRHDACNTADSR